MSRFPHLTVFLFFCLVPLNLLCLLFCGLWYHLLGTLSLISQFTQSFFLCIYLVHDHTSSWLSTYIPCLRSSNHQSLLWQLGCLYRLLLGLFFFWDCPWFLRSGSACLNPLQNYINLRSGEDDVSGNLYTHERQFDMHQLYYVSNTFLPLQIIGGRKNMKCSRAPICLTAFSLLPWRRRFQSCWSPLQSDPECPWALMALSMSAQPPTRPNGLEAGNWLCGGLYYDWLAGTLCWLLPQLNLKTRWMFLESSVSDGPGMFFQWNFLPFDDIGSSWLISSCSGLPLYWLKIVDPAAIGTVRT